MKIATNLLKNLLTLINMVKKNDLVSENIFKTLDANLSKFKKLK